MTEMGKINEAIKRGDYATAFKLCLPLAEQGDAHAQYDLGRMYDYGQGVAQDDAEAMTWYLKAAEQGDADAQNNIGVMYNEAWGVSRDYVQACMWLKLAAKQDHEEAKDDLAETDAKLTADQIAEAERLAAAWLAKR